jgi:hypothetical protein
MPPGYEKSPKYGCPGPYIGTQGTAPSRAVIASRLHPLRPSVVVTIMPATVKREYGGAASAISSLRADLGETFVMVAEKDGGLTVSRR